MLSKQLIYLSFVFKRTHTPFFLVTYTFLCNLQKIEMHFCIYYVGNNIIIQSTSNKNEF